MSGTIEQLNFKVILDDKTFIAAIQKDLKMAKELNTSLSSILNMKNKINKETTQQLVNAEKVKQAEAQTEREVAKTATQQQKLRTETERTRQAQQGHTTAVKASNTALISTKTIMRDLARLTGITFSLIGIRRFLSSMIEITGQFEVQRMALRSMLKDIDGADKIFQDLYQFSSDSTYRFSELAKYAKQLASFNIEQNKLLETTKMLGDVASGVGSSMDRIIVTYGHVKSMGFLRGIQLRSFAQNGVPILDELAKMLSEVEDRFVSLGEVYDRMTKREITFEMVEEGFRRMTSETGKFYKMQEVLAKTLSGQINILKGRWENMLAAVGESKSGFLKKTVKSISDIIADYENFGKYFKELIALFGVYQAALFSATLATKGLAAATEVGLLGSLKKLGASFLANPYILLAAAIAGATIAVYNYMTALTDVEKIQKQVEKGSDGYRSALAAENEELDRLFWRLKKAEEGTDEYKKAKLAIEKRFGPYIDKLREEGVAVDNLTTLYKELAVEIENANKQKFLESTTKGLTDTFGNIVNDIEADFKKTIKGGLLKGKLSLADEEELWQYVVGGSNELPDNLKKYLNIGERKNLRYSHMNDTYSVEQLRARYKRASDAFIEGMDEADRVFEQIQTNRTANTERDLKDWEERVTKAIGKIDESIVKKTGLAIKDNEDYFAYLERIGNEYKDINEEKDKALRVDKPMYEGWLKAIGEVDKALEGNILSDVRYLKTPWKGGSSNKDPFKDEREALKARISLFEKYKNAYDKLEPIFGSDANYFLANIFGPDASDNEKVDEEIVKMILRLRKLGKEGAEAADAIEARLGLDVVSQIVKRYNDANKALQAYERAFEKFDKDWGTGETGVSGKVEKALRDYNNEDKKIDSDYLDAQMKAYEAHKDNVDEISAETDALYDLYKARKKANETKRYDTIKGLADDIFKDLMAGYDLSDWNDKNLAQILDIKKALEELTVPESIRELLKDSPELLQMLEEELNKIRDKTLQKTVNPEVIKKWSKYAKQVATYIGKAGDAMKKLGEATNNTGLSDAGEVISAIGQNLNAAAEGYEKSGHWIGAVVGGVLDIFNQTVDAISQANEEMEQMEETIRSIRSEAGKASFEEFLSDGTDSIFGDNFVRKVRNAVDGLSEVTDKIHKLGLELHEYKKYLFLEKRMTDVFSSGDGSIPFVTKHTFWSGDTFKTLQEIADEFGMGMYDENDNLNPKLLQKILDTYGELNKEAKDWLTSAIEYSEEYALAMKQIEDATKSVFNNLADEMTDKFIDNFLAMGNAVDDLSDTFANLGDSILRSFLQSYILDEILGNYEQEATDMLKAYSKGQMTPDEYAEWLRGFSENVQKESETLTPAINSMIDAFKERGLMNIDEDTANSLGSGIKSITEDTANLLASYLNAIRADVSNMRSMDEKGWNAVGNMLPTLNDHLAQIAATNFDISQSTQSILSELRSVIGAPGTSGMVVRVEYA